MSIPELIYNKIEDAAVYHNNSDGKNEQVYLCSIAISLKRIADMMADKNDTMAPEFKPTIIMNAEEYARYQHKLKTF